MPRNASKLYHALFPLFAMIGLIFLSASFLWRKSPQGTIKRVLKQKGIDRKTIRQWIAVSAFETDGWTSRVFRDSNNLFNIISPTDSKINGKLPYGEGQTIYPNIEASAEALYSRVMVPFKYPLNYASITDQVQTMKSKGFFTSGLANYMAGVNQWYQKLYS